jgi:hypothetical protein
MVNLMSVRNPAGSRHLESIRPTGEAIEGAIGFTT